MGVELLGGLGLWEPILMNADPNVDKIMLCLFIKNGVFAFYLLDLPSPPLFQVSISQFQLTS